MDEKSFSRSKKQKWGVPFFLTFFIMAGLWMILSGKFDGFHLSLGLVSCFIVAFFSSDLLFTSAKIKGLAAVWWRFFKYLPWLLYQIFISNLHVLYLALHPKMMELIDPQIIVFKSHLKSDMSLLTFANSITLTPGTITIYVSIYGKFSVHAIDTKSGESLPGEMELRVGEIFGE